MIPASDPQLSRQAAGLGLRGVGGILRAATKSQKQLQRSDRQEADGTGQEPASQLQESRRAGPAGEGVGQERRRRDSPKSLQRRFKPSPCCGHCGGAPLIEAGKAATLAGKQLRIPRSTLAGPQSWRKARAGGRCLRAQICISLARPPTPRKLLYPAPPQGRRGRPSGRPGLWDGGFQRGSGSIGQELWGLCEGPWSALGPRAGHGETHPSEKRPDSWPLAGFTL